MVRPDFESSDTIEFLSDSLSDRSLFVSLLLQASSSRNHALLCTLDLIVDVAAQVSLRGRVGSSELIESVREFLDLLSQLLLQMVGPGIGLAVDLLGDTFPLIATIFLTLDCDHKEVAALSVN